MSKFILVNTLEGEVSININSIVFFRGIKNNDNKYDSTMISLSDQNFIADVHTSTIASMIDYVNENTEVRS